MIKIFVLLYIVLAHIHFFGFWAKIRTRTDATTIPVIVLIALCIFWPFIAFLGLLGLYTIPDAELGIPSGE